MSRLSSCSIALRPAPLSTGPRLLLSAALTLLAVACAACGNQNAGKAKPSVADATSLADALETGDASGESDVAAEQTDVVSATDVLSGTDTLGEGSYPKQPAGTIPTTPPRFTIPATHIAGPVASLPGVYVLPNGRLLTPQGQQMFLGSFPLGLTVHPNGQILYVANGGTEQAVQVVDLQSKTIVQTLKQKYIYRWMRLSADKKFLFVSGGPKADVTRYAVGTDGLLTDPKVIAVPPGFFGIALSPDGSTLYGLALSANLGGGKARSQLWKVSLASGEATAAVGVADQPYDLVVTDDGATAWLTTWRGGSVQRVDLTTMEEPKAADTLQLGFNAQGMLLSPDGKQLYVSAVEGDFVAVIDTASRTIVDKIPLGWGDAPGSAPQGRDPGFMALAPDGSRLYVACAMSNELRVVDTATRQVVGSILTGWYPSAVGVSADGKTIYVANAKGTGFPVGWNAEDSPEDGYLGTLSIVDVPADAALKQGEVDALDNMLGVAGWGRLPAEPAAANVLPATGGSKQLQHVVYLIRENKTFDSELGDLAGEVTGVTADPSYTLFGELYTPNLHKLAKEFCLLDNFYTDGDYSATGHTYAMAGKASDYVEKWYEISDRGGEQTWGVGPSSRPGRGFFFHNILAHGLSVQSFGEIVGMIDSFSLTSILHIDYPGLFFNMTILDRDKANWLADHFAKNGLPNFAVIVIPNNHTCCGGNPDAPSPLSMVADNDEATGIIIEAITKSKDWDSTAVFIFEDDPQDGGDSVEYHRSPLVVVSPWVKRGHLVKTHHATGSVHATMEKILNVSPLTELDALASPVYGCFTDQKVTTGYTAIPRTYPETLNKDEKKKKMTKRMKAAWAEIGPDAVDEHPGLGRLLWQMYKGTRAPWPRVRLVPTDLEDDD